MEWDESRTTASNSPAFVFRARQHQRELPQAEENYSSVQVWKALDYAGPAQIGR